MSYTPGPWKWEPDCLAIKYADPAYLSGLDGATIIQLEDQYPGYAECGEDLRMTIDEEDARLIAAAPDLLEALYGLLDGLDANENDVCGLSQIQWDDRIRYAREVIAKATGKEVSDLTNT